MAGISLSDILHNRPAVVPTIYGYVLPDLADHNGYIKVGFTDREDTENRIKEQLHTAGINNFKIVFICQAFCSSPCICYNIHDNKYSYRFNWWLYAQSHNH